MSELRSTSDLVKAGWTRPLIGKLLGEPDEKEDFKRGMFRGVRHFYLESRVQESLKSPEWVNLQERRRARAEAPGKRKAAYSRRYATWQGALVDASHALHSLNRYAKHKTFNRENRAAIYCLKNAFLELLYLAGYCKECWVHVQVLPAKVCRECGGDGGEDW